jgi:hypothetical protein
MPDSDLNQLEREVEAARAKLAGDLSVLRSPTTTAEFTEVLKQEAIETKDAVLDKAKSSLQSSIESLIEDIKARAAANPAAALAIGAGIAWRLIRHPPIATALVGAGLVSLFRTSPARHNGQAPADYLAYAKNRLVEQGADVADVAKGEALTLGKAVSEKVTATVGVVKDRVQDLTTQAAAATSEVAADATERAKTMWGESAGALEHAGQSARSAASMAMSRAGDTVNQWVPRHSEGNAIEIRDKLLLGAAGVAVATALGIAWQRRTAESSDEL